MDDVLFGDDGKVLDECNESNRSKNGLLWYIACDGKAVCSMTSMTGIDE